MQPAGSEKKSHPASAAPRGRRCCRGHLKSSASKSRPSFHSSRSHGPATTHGQTSRPRRNSPRSWELGSKPAWTRRPQKLHGTPVWWATSAAPSHASGRLSAENSQGAQLTLHSICCLRLSLARSTCCPAMLCSLHSPQEGYRHPSCASNPPAALSPHPSYPPPWFELATQSFAAGQPLQEL